MFLFGEKLNNNRIQLNFASSQKKLFIFCFACNVSIFLILFSEEFGEY